MNEIIRKPESVEQAVSIIGGLQAELDQMRGMLQVMADMVRVNNEQLAAMNRTVQALAMRQPVTRARANQLNAMVAERAAHLASAWGCEGAVNGIKRAIRGDVRQALQDGAGVYARSMADVPACQFRVVADLVSGWDDFTIRYKARKGEL